METVESGKIDISPDALTNVVKTVVADKDCSRNFLIFGINEEKEEKLDAQVEEILETVGRKPKVESQ